jgi:hypothetical protein
MAKIGRKGGAAAGHERLPENEAELPHLVA